ncbi:MAG: CTP synthase [Kiritimatiellia bacterium]|jgi:CTP synthase|nr:CTP synthase [Kiritimatiellia bacterium]
MSCKHIFVTGGVVSSLGKGLTAASIGLLLKRRGYRIRMQKLDPYLNVDPGTMSPYQHGEVYVTGDGRETDLDLGHYERFTGIPCDRHSNYTTGRIYGNVIAREREGGYLGQTVQVIPHVTDEIKRAIRAIEDAETDIAITEIGGTAGDIESQPYLEAIRQYHHEMGPGNSLFIHLTLVPYIRAAGEMKTKPSQQSVGILRSIGIVPELLICRCERPFAPEHRAKLALFCGVRPEHVIEECDVKDSIYEVPLDLLRQGVDEKILRLLDLPAGTPDMAEWNAMLERLIRPPHGEVEIAVVGKYISLRDAYKSVYEALTHGAVAAGVRVTVRMVESEEVERDGAAARLGGVHGILVPGGFGTRGVEGKIAAIRFAREQKVPFFGICLGMQCAVIEFARHACGLAEANSTELAPGTPHPVISLLDEQRGVTEMGGTMRLGDYPCQLKPGTRAAAAYRRGAISERHRHRYEFNPAFREKLEANGMTVAGVSPDGRLVEMVELGNHPWFVACQFHPEFVSSPVAPHPLFAAFVGAAARARPGTASGGAAALSERG